MKKHTPLTAVTPEPQPTPVRQFITTLNVELPDVTGEKSLARVDFFHIPAGGRITVVYHKKEVVIVGTRDIDQEWDPQHGGTDTIYYKRLLSPSERNVYHHLMDAEAAVIASLSNTTPLE